MAQKEERMASIRKRNGKWHAQVRRANCKSITKTFTLKKYAERWARDMEQKLDRQELRIDHQEATLRDLVNRYLTEVVPLKRSNESEGIVLQSFLKEKFVDLSIYKINAEHFAKYRDRRLKVIKPSTFVRQVGIMQHLYNIAVKEWGFELKNPVKSIRKPIIRNKRNRRLTDTECQQIVGGNYSHQLLRSIIELALETGMRRGELLRIQRDHIKDQTLLIPYAKNGESRIIPLTKRARQILDHAFLRIQGKHIDQGIHRGNRVPFLFVARCNGLPHILQKIFANSIRSKFKVSHFVSHHDSVTTKIIVTRFVMIHHQRQSETNPICCFLSSYLALAFRQ